jgi:hypothetical protein
VANFHNLAKDKFKECKNKKTICDFYKLFSTFFEIEKIKLAFIGCHFHTFGKKLQHA